MSQQDNKEVVGFQSGAFQQMLQEGGSGENVVAPKKQNRLEELKNLQIEGLPKKPARDPTPLAQFREVVHSGEQATFVTITHLDKVYCNENRLRAAAMRVEYAELQKHPKGDVPPEHGFTSGSGRTEKDYMVMHGQVLPREFVMIMTRRKFPWVIPYLINLTPQEQVILGLLSAEDLEAEMRAESQGSNSGTPVDPLPPIHKNPQTLKSPSLQRRQEFEPINLEEPKMTTELEGPRVNRKRIYRLAGGKGDYDPIDLMADEVFQEDKDDFPLTDTQAGGKELTITDLWMSQGEMEAVEDKDGVPQENSVRVLAEEDRTERQDKATSLTFWVGLIIIIFAMVGSAAYFFKGGWSSAEGFKATPSETPVSQSTCEAGPCIVVKAVLLEDEQVAFRPAKNQPNLPKGIKALKDKGNKRIFNSADGKFYADFSKADPYTDEGVLQQITLKPYKDE